MNIAETTKAFQYFLISEEKSKATIDKYVRDVIQFLRFVQEKEIDKNLVLEYKAELICRYAPSSVNSMLAAINLYLEFIEKSDCKVKLVKIQRQLFAKEERELTKEEYRRLLKAAKNTRISAVIQTICGTGIRVSELSFITVEAVKEGKASVRCKNKTRIIFIPKQVQKMLKAYIKKAGITAGPVFVTKKGNPLDRSNIWKEMKALCSKADVSEKKVFPHNLRHLFARTFYSIEKDIVRLADLLGHSSINTTRIYTIECGAQHLKSIEHVNILLAT